MSDSRNTIDRFLRAMGAELMSDDELREMCAIDGDWGGTSWGEAILDLLDRPDVVTSPGVSSDGGDRP